jgi:hypothetical protein
MESDFPTLLEVAHGAQRAFEQVRRCGDSLARECFLLFVAHAANRCGSGAGRLAQAPEPLSAFIDLMWLEGAYRRVRRARPSLARAFFWLIVSELAVGARHFDYINPESFLEPQTANAGLDLSMAGKSTGGESTSGPRPCRAGEPRVEAMKGRD